MGIAGEIVELPQFSKHGQIGVGAESAFQLGQIGDLGTVKVLAKDRGIEGCKTLPGVSCGHANAAAGETRSSAV
jgi:hypothetical protein